MTVVAQDRAVLVFGAHDMSEVESFASGAGLRDELVNLRVIGDPEAGSPSRLSVREASSEEAERWRNCFDQALAQGEILRDPGAFGVLLVPAAGSTNIATAPAPRPYGTVSYPTITG